MEGSLLNKRGTFRTNGDVLRSHQLPSHLPNDDEHYIRPGNSRTMANHIHGRHGYTYSKTGRRDRATTPRTTPYICSTHPRKITRTQSLPQTRKMHLQAATN